MRTLPTSSALGAALAVLLLALFLPVAPARAAWTNNGNPVASGAGDELTGFGFGAAATAVAPDDGGGCFVAYLASNGDSLRINRLSGDTGARLWGTNGVKVNEGGNAAGIPHVVSDLAGGCWVAWLDTRTGSALLYAQRFDANGAALGTAGGFLVAAANGISLPFGQSIAASPGGDLLLAFWRTGGLGMEATRIHMQSGFAPVIELPAFQVTADTGSLSDAPIQLFADGAGGGILAWASNRASLPGGAGTVRIVASRFTSTGVKQWGAEGAVVQAGAGISSIGHRALWDGANLFVCWRHGTATSVTGVHAQRLDGNGVAQWGATTSGLAITDNLDTPFDDHTSTNQQPQIAPDGSGGVWIGWLDGRNWTQPAPNGFQHAQDIYAQRLNTAGTAQLQANGAPVDSFPGSVAELKTAPGAGGELLMVYRSLLNEVASLGDVHAIRVTTAGTRATSQILNKTGSPSVADGRQDNPVLVPDGFGGMFVAWDDNRADPNLDVYATHRTSAMSLAGPTLTVTAPNGGESLHGLEPVNITWTSTLPPLASVKLEYKFGSSRFLIAASAPNTGSFSWAPPSLSGSAYRVVVSETGDNVPADSSDANFSVCAPMEVPGAWGPFTTPNDVALADLNADGILDLLVPGAAGLDVEMGQGVAGVGNGGFANTQTTALPSSARDVATADLDGDGNLDAVVSVSTGVTVLAGLGNGSFIAGSSFATGTNVRGVILADFNEDGILDVAAVNGGSNNVSVLIGSGANGAGNGSFAAAVSYAVATNPSRLVARDFNGDGILDLAVTNNSSASVSILLGNGAAGKGNGTFAAAASVTTAASPLGICAGDFDEDGLVDLAVSTGTGVSVLIGNGNGTFDAFVDYGIGTSARDVVAVDLDADGRQDLICLAGVTDRTHVLFGDGTGTTGDGTFTVGGNDFAGDQPTQLVIGDLLEDGIPDGVIVNGLGNDAYVFWGRCANALATTVTVTSPNGSNYFQVGTNQTITWTKGAAVQFVDVEVSRDNGAHWRTIASGLTGTSFSWTVTPPQAINTARIRVRDSQLQNRADQSNGAFTIGTNPLLVIEPNGGQSLTAFEAIVVRWGSSGGFANAKLELEVDGVLQTLLASTPNDGFEGVFMPNVDSDSVKVRVSDAADGNPADASDAFFAICGRMSGPDLLSSGIRTSGAVTGDFNADGITDLAVASSGPDSIAIHLGLGSAGVGNGTFGPATFVAVTGLSGRLATGDFNSDGITDLVAPNLANGVRILPGQGAGGIGNGSFASGAVVPTGAAGHDVAVADLDEDGIDDLAVVSFAANRIDVLIGQGAGGAGNGTFAAAVPYTTADGPEHPVIADFNEDGIWDIAVPARTSSKVSVLLGVGSGGNGSGTFAPAVNYTAPSGAFGLVARDFQDGGILDLAVLGTGGLWTLRGGGLGGVGNGTFPSAVVSTVVPALRDIAVMDVNFDEFPDLVGTALSTPTVSFNTNDTGAEFYEAGSIPLPSAGLRGVLAGDFDENGVHDILATLENERRTAILLGDACGATPGTVTLDPPAGATGSQAASPARVAADWATGSEQAIHWTKSPNVFAVNLAVSRDGGSRWRTIAREVPGNAFTWTVTPPASANVLLRVSDAASPGVSDASDAPIAIVGGNVDVPSAAIPSRAAFSQGRPNPARGDVSFEMALPEAHDVSVEVFDLVGRRIATLASGRYEPGYHALRWPSGGAGAGIYFVRARWDGYDATHRVVRMP